jgi:hypothetical protein
MTAYIPKFLDQTFTIIIYPNNIYMLCDSNMDKLTPMYVGNNRIYLEQMLKKIKEHKGKKTLLKVYEFKNDELVMSKQSIFYKFLPFQ